MKDLIYNIPGKWGKMTVIPNKKQKKSKKNMHLIDGKINVGHNTNILTHELYNSCFILHEWK